jgi:hypothetical protein
MIVVLDTNVWIQELGLGSAVGSAVRFYLKQKGAKVALPEVVRLETEHHLESRLKEFVAGIQRNHRQLLAVFRTLKDISLPDDKAIESVVSGVFSQTGVSMFDVPFSLESAKQSFQRTVDKIPPSDKTQEFKDGVIWADCVKLLNEDDVYLVSADRAFYGKREYSEGMAEELSSECRGLAHSLRILPSLANLLEEVRQKIEINVEDLSTEFFRSQGDRIYTMLTNNGFQLGNHVEVEYSQFVTEDPNKLYLEFNIRHDCKEIAGLQSTTAVITAKGDCNYQPIAQLFSDMRSYGEELTIQLANGEEKTQRNVVLHVGGIVLGHREVSHTVRLKVD